MDSKPSMNFDAIIALERSDLERLRNLSMKERAALIEAACESAVEIGMSRQRMSSGEPAILSEPGPSPWPASTWKHLAEWSRSARKAR